MSGVRVDRTVALQYHYIGDPDTNGSLRLLRSGNDFTVEERIGGSWEARDITGNSLAIFDPVVKDESDVDEIGALFINLYSVSSPAVGNLIHIDVDPTEWDDYTILIMHNSGIGVLQVASLRLDLKVNAGQSVSFGTMVGAAQLEGLDHVHLPEDAVSSLLIDKPAGQSKYYIRQII